MNHQQASSTGRAIAIIGAIVAIVIGYPITGWILTGPTGPGIVELLEFLGANALLAVVGAFPGLVIGDILARKSRRQ